MSIPRFLLVAAIAIAVPLVLPAHWVGDGLVPDIALLLVLYAALRGTPDSAAFLGVALGLATMPWTAAPVAQTALLLGGVGWVVGHLSRELERDRLPVQCALAFAGALIVRGGALAAATLERGGVSELPDVRLHGAVTGVILAAVSAALAAPFVLAIIERSRLLAPLEVRRRRRV